MEEEEGEGGSQSNQVEHCCTTYQLGCVTGDESRNN